MKLPFNVLQGLAAAVACVGVAGCTVSTAAPSGPSGQQPNGSQYSTEQGVDPSGSPNQPPGQVCQPDGCPNCGRG
jgi:hypothetical protein